MYSIALAKREYSFSCFSSKSQVVTPQMRGHKEMVQMRGHNIQFFWVKLTKIIPNSLNTLSYLEFCFFL